MIILKPFELLLSGVFTLAVGLTGNYGISLLIMSVVITLLTTPIYLLADKWSAAEKALQDEMKPEIDSIKAAFSGQKQYYLIQTVHRIHHYKFFYPLRSMLGILFQIPFFFAAYNVLSSYTGYNGIGWGAISDLAKPDGLLFGLNFLPFLMTFFNLISSFYYTHSFKAKDNKQQILLALVFLLLLYDSPAALLIYWTSNNFLSIIKNMLIGKQQVPAKVSSDFSWKNLARNRNLQFVLLDFYFFASLFIIDFDASVYRYCILLQTAVLFGYVLWKCIRTRFRFLSVPLVLFGLLYALTLALYLFSNLYQKYYLPQLALALLLGYMNADGEQKRADIKVLVLESVAFSGYLFLLSPLRFYVQNIGEFPVVFPSLVVQLMAVTGIACIVLVGIAVLTRRVGFFEHLMIAAFAAVCAYTTLLRLNLGLLSGFQFQNEKLLLNYPIAYYVKDFVVVFFIWYFSKWFYSKYRKHIPAVLGLLCGIVVITMIPALMHISDTADAEDHVAQSAGSSMQHITLSKNHQNVVVIMADMMNGNYVNRYFAENPDKKASFSGFVNYADCIPIAGSTLASVPGIFGGDAFAYRQILDNDDSYEVDVEHAMTGFFGTFISHGYDCTNINHSAVFKFMDKELPVPLNAGNYHEINDYEYFQFLNSGSDDDSVMGRANNYLISVFPVFNIAPLSAKVIMYDKGQWNNYGLALDYQTHYVKQKMALFELLHQVTDFSDTDENVLIYWATEMTHDPFAITDKGELFTNVLDADRNYPYYSAKYTMNKLADFMDYLKLQGVYDNTLVLVVSDHGNYWTDNEIVDLKFNQFPGNLEWETHLERAQSVFFCKDFDSSEEYRVSDVQVQNTDVSRFVDEYVFNQSTAFSDLQKETHRIRTYGYPVAVNGKDTTADYEITGPLTKSSSWTYKGIGESK